MLARQAKATVLRTAEVDHPRTLVVSEVVENALLRAPGRRVLPRPAGGSGVVALGDHGVVAPELCHSLVRPTRDSAVGWLRPGLVHNTVGVSMVVWCIVIVTQLSLPFCHCVKNEIKKKKFKHSSQVFVDY